MVSTRLSNASKKTHSKKDEPQPRLKPQDLKRGAAAKAAEAEDLDEVGDSGEANTQKKRKQVQKTTHRDAVGAVHGAAVSADTDKNNDVTDGIMVLSSCASDAGPKGNTAIGLKNAAYKGSVSMWAHGCIGISAPTQFTKVTMISSATAPPITPEGSEINDNAHITGSLLDEDEEPEQLAAHALVNMKKQPSGLCTVLGAMDVVEFTHSKLLPSSVTGDVVMDDNKAESEDIIIVDSVEASPVIATGSKRVTAKTNVDVFDDLDVLPKKRVKKEPIDAPEKKATAAEKKATTGEVLRVKYKNSDLPAGCQDSNTWRGLLIPTIAHAAGGDDVHPWLVEDDALILILTKAWKTVYTKNLTLINHLIVPGDAVYYMAKQCLSEWHGGFGSTAIMMITSLMAVDPLYESEDNCVEFTDFWLEDNKFLFGDVDSDNKKEWSGMWQSTFILQTFMVHLNYTQGHVLVPELNSEEPVLQTVLSLSAVAVKCALVLLVNKEMTFEIKTTTSKGKKKPSQKGKASAAETEWITVISKNETFLEPLRGYDTQMFLTTINHVPTDKMKTIIEQAQQYMKAMTCAGQLKMDGVLVDTQNEDFDEEYADLLTFQLSMYIHGSWLVLEFRLLSFKLPNC
ncbi:uncharacterized protein BJ212DRAFT_1298368 [Suillus subaureus]|uniref:Uncharacterized protein n=1 Tax=Suillus subaureus TaxID=48587 RepID=A0A9P7EDW3_9AGAM|nr:uncharacterized protein BJ212DRAFT_1298368 [Suillus subaureus]KAG1819101.1 hypothetical protein BJ212DRAFT_1298368 [Suillus subaureus]